MQEKIWELETSKATLEEYLSRAVENIVYPYGTSQTVDGETLSLARRVGYRQGFSNVPFKLFEPAGMNIGRFGLPADLNAHTLRLHLQQRTELSQFGKRPSANDDAFVAFLNSLIAGYPMPVSAAHHGDVANRVFLPAVLLSS